MCMMQVRELEISCAITSVVQLLGDARDWWVLISAMVLVLLA